MKWSLLIAQFKKEGVTLRFSKCVRKGLCPHASSASA